MKKVKLICEGSTVNNNIALYELGISSSTKVIEANEAVKLMIESIKRKDESFKEIFEGLDEIVVKNIHRLENKMGTQKELIQYLEEIPSVTLTSLYSGTEILEQEDERFCRDLKDLVRSSFLYYP